MNDLDLAVLHRASTHGLHSVSMLLDANDAITVTVNSPTPKTTIKSVIRIEGNAAECSFSFFEKELKHGGKIELTSHIIHCETLTDVIQILDKFRHHLRAAYIDPDALKMHLFDKKDKLEVTSGKITNQGSSAAELSDVYVKVAVSSQTPATMSSPPPPPPVRGSEPNCHTAKKEDDLPFNTDLYEEDKP